MTPYYEHAGITIYHGDCRDVLPMIEQCSAHVIVTDPPYGLNYVGRGDQGFGAIAGDDGSLDIQTCISLAVGCLKRGRHAYVFGPIDLGQIEAIARTTELVWDKAIQGMGGVAPWANQHERIAFGVKHSGGPVEKATKGGGAARLRRGSVLRYARTHGTANNRHPTEKPVMLLRELIESSSKFGEIVLDPFAGVGSTLVAAQLESRQAIGIEIEERYCEIAARRLQQEVLPLEAAV